MGAVWPDATTSCGYGPPVPPHRPREHELETLSRLQFEQLVPSGWVVREVSRDYGVDLEVEIFEDGESTGMTFKVQLKGSDRTAAPGPSRRIKTDTLGYWKGLDVPVLIAYYTVDSGTMYGRWAHTVGREPGFDRDAKTTTVRFSYDEILAATTIGSRLSQDVVAVRALRAGRLPRPLPVRLTADDDTVPGLTAARLGVRLRQAIRDRGLHRDVRLLAPGDTSTPAVEVSLTRSADMILRVALPSDLASIRAVLPANLYGPGDAADLLADDVLVAVAFVVERTGAVAVAGRLLGPSAAGSVLISIPDVALSAASVLADQDLARLALRLALRRWGADDPAERDLGDIYYRALLHQLDGLTVSEREELVNRMRRRADAERSSPNPRRAGRGHYNLAQVLNATGRTSEALDAMDLALRYDPGYAGRDYFFRERGGMRWQDGRYGDAADDYRQALRLGADAGELVPLLADALLYGGRYAETEAVLADWLPAGHHLDGLAVLVRVAVAEVRAVTELDIQERKAAANQDITAAGDDPAALGSLLASSDALDPRIWLQMVDDAAPLPRLVLVALMALNSADAWAIATVRALWPEDPASPYTARALIEAGHRLSNSPYADAVEQALTHVSDDGHAEAVRDALYAILDGADEGPTTTTLRMVFD